MLVGYRSRLCILLYAGTFVQAAFPRHLNISLIEALVLTRETAPPNPRGYISNQRREFSTILRTEASDSVESLVNATFSPVKLPSITHNSWSKPPFWTLLRNSIR
jgi:hypothetical protein